MFSPPFTILDIHKHSHHLNENSSNNSSSSSSFIDQISFNRVEDECTFWYQTQQNASNRNRTSIPVRGRRIKMNSDGTIHRCSGGGGGLRQDDEFEIFLDISSFARCHQDDGEEKFCAILPRTIQQSGKTSITAMILVYHLVHHQSQTGTSSSSTTTTRKRIINITNNNNSPSYSPITSHVSNNKIAQAQLLGAREQQQQRNLLLCQSEQASLSMLRQSTCQPTFVDATATDSTSQLLNPSAAAIATTTSHHQQQHQQHHQQKHYSATTTIKTATSTAHALEDDLASILTVSKQSTIDSRGETYFYDDDDHDGEFGITVENADNYCNDDDNNSTKNTKPTIRQRMMEGTSNQKFQNEDEKKKKASLTNRSRQLFHCEWEILASSLPILAKEIESKRIPLTSFAKNLLFYGGKRNSSCCYNSIIRSRTTTITTSPSSYFLLLPSGTTSLEILQSSSSSINNMLLVNQLSSMTATNQKQDRIVQRFESHGTCFELSSSSSSSSVSSQQQRQEEQNKNNNKNSTKFLATPKVTAQRIWKDPMYHDKIICLVTPSSLSSSSSVGNANSTADVAAAAASSASASSSALPAVYLTVNSSTRNDAVYFPYNTSSEHQTQHQSSLSSLNSSPSSLLHKTDLSFYFRSNNNNNNDDLLFSDHSQNFLELTDLADPHSTAFVICEPGSSTISKVILCFTTRIRINSNNNNNSYHQQQQQQKKRIVLLKVERETGKSSTSSTIHFESAEADDQKFISFSLLRKPSELILASVPAENNGSIFIFDAVCLKLLVKVSISELTKNLLSSSLSLQNSATTISVEEMMIKTWGCSGGGRWDVRQERTVLFWTAKEKGQRNDSTSSSSTASYSAVLNFTSEAFLSNATTNLLSSSSHKSVSSKAAISPINTTTRKQCQTISQLLYVLHRLPSHIHYGLGSSQILSSLSSSSSSLKSILKSKIQSITSSSRNTAFLIAGVIEAELRKRWDGPLRSRLHFRDQLMMSNSASAVASLYLHSSSEKHLRKATNANNNGGVSRTAGIVVSCEDHPLSTLSYSEYVLLSAGMERSRMLSEERERVLKEKKKLLQQQQQEEEKTVSSTKIHDDKKSASLKANDGMQQRQQQHYQVTMKASTPATTGPTVQSEAQKYAAQLMMKKQQQQQKPTASSPPPQQQQQQQPNISSMSKSAIDASPKSTNSAKPQQQKLQHQRTHFDHHPEQRHDSFLKKKFLSELFEVLRLVWDSLFSLVSSSDNNNNIASCSIDKMNAMFLFYEACEIVVTGLDGGMFPNGRSLASILLLSEDHKKKTTTDEKNEHDKYYHYSSFVPSSSPTAPPTTAEIDCWENSFDFASNIIWRNVKEEFILRSCFDHHHHDNTNNNTKKKSSSLMMIKEVLPERAFCRFEKFVLGKKKNTNNAKPTQATGLLAENIFHASSTAKDYIASFSGPR